MRRHLFTILAALSLLLCVAVCALWVRNYFRSDLLAYATGASLGPASHERGGFAWAAAGSLHVNCWVRSGIPAGTEGRGGWAWQSHAADPGATRAREQYFDLLRGVRLFGFVASRQHRASSATATAGRTDWLVVVPYWQAVALTAPLPGVWLVKQRRLRRRPLRTDLCPACGYDLRASPERCPECGAEVRSVGAAVNLRPPTGLA